MTSSLTEKYFQKITTTSWTQLITFTGTELTLLIIGLTAERQQQSTVLYTDCTTVVCCTTHHQLTKKSHFHAIQLTIVVSITILYLDMCGVTYEMITTSRWLCPSACACGDLTTSDPGLSSRSAQSDLQTSPWSRARAHSSSLEPTL